MAIIRIHIVDNTVVENNEIFIAALSSEDTNVVIDSKSITIMIVDTDSKYSKKVCVTNTVILTHSLLPKFH